MAIFNVRGFTLADLFLKAIPNETTAIKWFQDHDLLWQFLQCQLCGQLMLFKELVRFCCSFCQISHSIMYKTSEFMWQKIIKNDPFHFFHCITKDNIHL